MHWDPARAAQEQWMSTSCTTASDLEFSGDAAYKRRLFYALKMFAVRVAAFSCEAAAAKHPDRLRNALFEGFYDGGFFLVLFVLYGLFKRW